MEDSNLEGKKPDETCGSRLDADANAIQRLGKVLVAAVKSRAFGRPEYGNQIEDARRIASQIDWEGLKATIERKAGEVREREETGLQSGRGVRSDSARAERRRASRRIRCRSSFATWRVLCARA